MVRACQTYPFAQDETQAIQLAWRAIALSERPEDQSRRRAMMQRLGPLKVLDVGALELFTWHIITAGIGDKIRAGLKRLTGVHPQRDRRFEPDPALLDRVSGYDRFLNQLTDGAGRIILDVRVEEVEPARDPSPLAEPERSGHPTATEPMPRAKAGCDDPTKQQTTPTPEAFVADYITKRLAVGLDYSGRGRPGGKGCPGFGRQAGFWQHVAEQSRRKRARPAEETAKSRRYRI